MRLFKAIGIAAALAGGVVLIAAIACYAMPLWASLVGGQWALLWVSLAGVQFVATTGLAYCLEDRENRKTGGNDDRITV